jgi:uncharacterized BrkB/YihY/UPF0761 family membrane protein
MPWTTSDRVVALRDRHIAIDVGVDTLDGWRRHISGRNASVVAFFGFLSIFPLMLAATTILGFVLRENQDLRDKIIEGALEDIPVIGEELANDPTAISGNIWVLLIGLGGALWSATKAFAMIHVAQDDVWEVDVDHRAAMPVQRGRALLGLLIMGGAQIATLAMTTFVSAVDLPIGGRILLYVTALAVNILVLAAIFHTLTSAEPTWRQVWPGAIPAGFVYVLIQQFGTEIVVRITKNAGDTYGQFALVLGIVTWLSFMSISAIMAVELNAAIVRRRNGSLAAVQPDA